MTEQQFIALNNPCFLGGETVHPRYGYAVTREHSVVLTVNAGYE